MSDRITKKFVTKRVQLLAKITGKAYELDYAPIYGGYVITFKDYPHSLSGLGRLSGREMVAFIDGLIAMYEHIERENKS